MNRTAVNPWDWSLSFGFNQAEIVQGTNRTLFCSGQTSVDHDGSPLHDGEMRAQIVKSLENLSTVLQQANMSAANVVQLRVFTTDIDQTKMNFDLFGQLFGPFGVKPAMTLVGATGFAMPEIMVEIETVACD